MANSKTKGTLAGLSVKAILITMLSILLFGIYVGILIYGENSLTVLKNLEEKKQRLFSQATLLKKENQKLQKEYFELKTLRPTGVTK